MSKARSISKLTPASTGVVSIAGTAALKVPVGTTAERPSGEVGLVRYNSTTGSTEVYNQNTGWSSIGASPPTITSVSPVTYNGESGTSFTINGANFTSDAIIKFITNTGTEYTAATITFANTSQIIATTPQDFTVAQEPLDVKIIQASGTSTLIDCIDCGGTPTWTTAAGNIKTIYDSLRATTTLQVTASDPDTNATISYSLVSGALPTGMTLNSSTGAITGTASAVASDTTYNFTIRATDNAGNTSDRAFSCLVKAPVTQIFSYTGSDQTWTVPTGLTSATVYVWGAGGSSGYGSNTPGGSGGYAEGVLATTPGNTYKIVVGQGGDLSNVVGSGGGGGGLSGIFNTSSTVFTGGAPTAGMQSNAIIIAGGGGGGAGGNTNNDNAGTYGGAGGGTTGGTGRADTRAGNPVGSGTMNGGGGGTQSAGGAFAADTGGGFGDPTAGIALQGGKAAVQAGNRSYMYGGGGPGSNAYSGSYGGAGGGGGYYGGGGGSDYYSSGGGGGSGYIGGVTSGVNTQGNTSTSANASAPNVANASNSSIGLGGAGANTAGGNGEIRIKY